MPSRERKLRAAANKEAKAALDHAFQNAPRHVLARLGKPSTLSAALNLKGTPYAGVPVFDEHGNLCKRQDPEGLGANAERHEERERAAQQLKQEYPLIWGKRGTAKRIALDKGISLRTVQKYYKEFP